MIQLTIIITTKNNYMIIVHTTFWLCTIGLDGHPGTSGFVVENKGRRTIFRRFAHVVFNDKRSCTFEVCRCDVVPSRPIVAISNNYAHWLNLQHTCVQCSQKVLSRWEAGPEHFGWYFNRTFCLNVYLAR